MTQITHFLIVGAMKAGTTTLYRDLSRHPGVFMPGDKEPEILVRYVGARAIAAAYAEHFAGAAPGQVCGEASTAYTKRPDHEGAAALALAHFGPELRIIYMRREPVSRLISQYKHEVQHKTITEPIEAAIAKHPRLIAYGRYDWQIAPWIETFGKGNVLQIDLEDYSRDKAGKLDAVMAHLGLDPALMPAVDPNARANRADEAKTVSNPLLAAVIGSRFYRRRIKGLMSDGLREKLRNAILSKPEDTEILLSTELEAHIRQESARDS
jgi:hypothetical protein